MIVIKLKETMKMKGFTISTLAEKTGLHRNGISKIINGRNNGIEFDTLQKLCEALDCNVQDIIFYSKNESK